MYSPSWSDTDTEALDEELAIEAKRALAYLQSTRNYRYVEFLAQGGYGWVSLVYDDNKSRSLAVKCTNDTSEMELSWWPKLDHPNILPLLEYITLDTCTIFIMPAMRKDLWMVVNEPRFYDEELSFGQCRIWLRDVASALDYLHSQFLCHLDLKLDNVFLKHDGYACLGDFSLLSDIREVPSGFHFLEIYEPPEYTKWCHGAPPEAIASSTKFGGDKADMWQYGILTIDLLTNLKVTDSKDSKFVLFHHDLWPLLQKILLHEEYLSYLLEETFAAYIFKEEHFNLCHDFVKNILCLEPDARMSAEKARNHPFVDTEWPQLPKEFTLPTLVIEHLSETKPLPTEEIDEPTLKQVSFAVKEDEKDESIGAFDVMKRKMKKMQKEKIFRRESIAVEAGKKLLEIKQAPPIKNVPRKPTPWLKKKISPRQESHQSSDSKGDTENIGTTQVKEHKAQVIGKTSTGQPAPIKVTAIKKQGERTIMFKKKIKKKTDMSNDDEENK